MHFDLQKLGHALWQNLNPISLSSIDYIIKYEKDTYSIT